MDKPRITSRWNEDVELVGSWALDERIVKKLGWHVVTLDEPERIWVPNPGVELVLTCYIADERGERVMDNWQTPELCWEHCPIPSFSSDMNEALRLVKGYDVKMKVWANGATSVDISSGTIQYHGYSMESPATAVCLAWWEAQNPTQPAPDAPDGEA
jgi:hypothetical protein